MNFNLSKRHKIILTSIILSLGLLSTQLVPIYLTYKFIGGLTILAYLTSLWALWEGLDRLKAVVLMILPTLFTLAAASYYFLLPLSWWSRLPVAVLFGITFYTLLLSQNVFNVASMRTIPLYRVASTTVFVLTLITAYLLFNVIFSFNLIFIWNALLIFLLSFPLILHLIWSIEMEGITASILIYSLILAFLVAELGLALSFWPISKAMASLMLATTIFITLGITTHALRERLTRGIVWEYVGWGVLVFIIAAITTSWVG
ncbi:MAG: hypothetical protein UU73_C0003G0167 [Candidatus Daviesbacteria bacterium GW2011_GWA1_41_61]|uniref:Uncharacterized protein n=1 Tax=Candidatus Daviesbacteria bacterium GW2011_GWA2_40_9 TaxID=1618424 RepID=A0A0G0U7H2_9BACT|nr:MAG: hypothetical protein UU26_C0003G0059 [Candidatus Daviesbacteria bacterium GW2011_GWC1_40_9]KKR83136.1 MAG: hypothetical protein UU29_C0007G0006 [Candidatus Daviesbacteria bacterium GW2011_GWA2_40_9]KKR93483.1 MAG: hypothetical protein UU44_C0002G0144 [Candidatus Daviesbacteria bacterium GW2011_GWB1_41_15]KKS14968.1 MAG: hypothetical protein UU73_C0003G0167 [Candidatus Daviesbacteria bacterium GW2011_GWA1_41_61]